jgi:hypothetical protein
VQVKQRVIAGFLLAVGFGAGPVVAQDQGSCSTYTPECAKQQQERIRLAAGATADNPKPAQPQLSKVPAKGIAMDTQQIAAPDVQTKQQAKATKQQEKFAKKLAQVKAQFPGIEDWKAEKIATKTIFIGMTVPMFQQVWRITPTHVNNTYGADGGLEQQLVYDITLLNETDYFYFRNGVLTSFQTSK